MQDKIAIITVSYKQNEYTLKCVQSIIKSSYQNFDLLVIDNGPSNEEHQSLLNEIKKLNDNRIHLVKSEKNLGYVGGINYGFLESKNFNPDYFLILNNDTIINKNSIEILLNCCKRYNNNAIVSGKVYHYDQPNKLQYIGSKCINEKVLKFEWIGKDEEDLGQYDIESERDILDDIFWLFSNETYKILGGYSEDFFFNGESTDYALRAKNNGIKLIYTPEAKLWHKGSISFGGRKKNPFTSYWIVKSALVLRYKHISQSDFKKYYKSVIADKLIKRFIISIIRLFTGKTSDFRVLKANYKALKDFNKWRKK